MVNNEGSLVRNKYPFLFLSHCEMVYLVCKKIAEQVMAKLSEILSPYALYAVGTVIDDKNQLITVLK